MFLISDKWKLKFYNPQIERIKNIFFKTTVQTHNYNFHHQYFKILDDMEIDDIAPYDVSTSMHNMFIWKSTHND